MTLNQFELESNYKKLKKVSGSISINDDEVLPKRFIKFHLWTKAIQNRVKCNLKLIIYNIYYPGLVNIIKTGFK